MLFENKTIYLYITWNSVFVYTEVGDRLLTNIRFEIQYNIMYTVGTYIIRMYNNCTFWPETGTETAVVWCRKEMRWIIRRRVNRNEFK